MDLGEHRIFKHMSAPMRIVGLTIDELIMGIIGFSAFFFIKNKMLGFCFLVGAITGIWLWKKVKKQAAGFSVVSFINWFFGGRVAGIESYWPQSNDRRWVA